MRFAAGVPGKWRAPVHVGPVAHFAVQRPASIGALGANPVEAAADEAVAPPLLVVIVARHIDDVSVRILA